jgi:Gpi18-like mannosyltransferase
MKFMHSLWSKAGARGRIGALLLAALAVRVVLTPLYAYLPGNALDEYAWERWMQTIHLHGILNIFTTGSPDVPNLGYLWVLWLLSKFYALTGSPYAEYPVGPGQYSALPLPLHLLLKVPPLVFDLGLIAAVYVAVLAVAALRRPQQAAQEAQSPAQGPPPSYPPQGAFAPHMRPEQLALIGAAVIAFQPAVLYDSAVWAQIDAPLTAAMLVAMVLAARGSPGWGWAAWAAGFIVKPQPVFVLPVLVVLTFRRTGWRGLTWGVLCAALLIVAVLSPWILHGDLRHIFGLYNTSFSGEIYAQRLSNAAWNLWWFWDVLSHPLPGNAIFSFLPALTFKIAGLVLSAAAALLGAAYVWRRPNLIDALIAAAYMAFAFYMLPISTHERYLYPFLGLLLPVVIVRREWLWLYVPASVAFFLNLVVVAPPIHVWSGRWDYSLFSLAVATVNVALFAAFTVVLSRRVAWSAAATRATSETNATVWWLLGGALLVHLVLAPVPGYERDLYNFGTWTRVALEFGVNRVSERVWCDYPPGYLYLLKGIGLLWTWSTGLPVPADGSLGIRFLVKLVPTLADLATAWVLFRIAVAKIGRRGALLVLAAYAYNPAILFNGAVWGQADSVTALLLLLAAWGVWSGRTALGFGLLAGAILVKVQAVAVLPALLLAAMQRRRLAGLFAAARGGAVVTLGLLLPFYWVGRVGSVIDTFLSTSGRYPFLSLYAYNPWWLAGGGPAARSTSDAMRVGNALLTYHGIGMLSLGAATALILWRLLRDLQRTADDDARVLCEACALQLLAFYLFPTEMHERYIVPVVGFAAVLCVWRPVAWWLYGVLSVGVLVSLASAMHATYPESLGALGTLLRPGQPEATWLSVLFMSLFAVLLFWTSDKRFQIVAPLAIGAVALATAGVAAAPVRSAQLLSNWEPTEQSQQWGTMHRNRTVDDHRLSAMGFMFRHGIGTHAASRLTYHLNGAFRTFDTAFAVDDEANRGQMIRFRILTDGYARFDSGNISARGFPRHVRVPVDGAQFLTLEVLDGGDGINFDHADWLEPLLVR